MQCEHGRAAAYLIDIGKDTCACLYNMYGFSGGRDCKQLSIRTDKVFEACWTNHQTHYKGYPAIFTGDLNTDTPNMPFLNKLVDAQKIIDLGAHGSKWGGTDNEYTCISPTTHKPTRNDYILVCPLTWNMVTKFRVQHDQGFPTHSLPIVTLDVGQAAGVHTVSNAPMAIMDALTKLVLQTRVQGRTLSDDARHNSNNTDTNNSSDDMQGNNSDSDSDDSSSDADVTTEQVAKNKSQNVKRRFQDADTIEPTDPDWKDMLGTYQKHVTDKLAKIAGELDSALRERSSDHFLAAWAGAQDAALGLILLQHSPLEGKTKGHGRVTLKELPCKTKAKFKSSSLQNQVDDETIRLQRIMRSCRQQADKFRLLRRSDLTDTHRDTLTTHCDHTNNNLYNIIDWNNEDELDFLYKYNKANHQHPHTQVLLKQFANTLEKRLLLHTQNLNTQRKEERMRKAEQDKYHKRIYKQLGTHSHKPSSLPNAPGTAPKEPKAHTLHSRKKWMT